MMAVDESRLDVRVVRTNLSDEMATAIVERAKQCPDRPTGWQETWDKDFLDELTGEVRELCPKWHWRGRSGDVTYRYPDYYNMQNGLSEEDPEYRPYVVLKYLALTVSVVATGVDEPGGDAQ